MKAMTRSKFYAPMAAIILTAALAIPAAAQKQVPFRGIFHGKDTVNPPTITTSGTGNGTHIGNFSLTQETSLTSAPPAGSAHWVAANGDRIESTFVVVSFQLNTPPGYATITESHTITGGTGRFAGAQGSFNLERLHVLAPNADGTHDTFGSYQGSITPPGATH
jgi:hypothetical protein